MLIRVSREDSRAYPRLDRLLAEKTGITRSQIRRLMDSGMVTVNGTPARANLKAREGDSIEVSVPAPRQEGLVAEDIPLEVLHMDDDLAVVDKPAGMVVYPSHGHLRGTLMNALAGRARSLASVGAPLRPGVVHRLDKDTSGAMVVALSDRAYYGLLEQFRDKSIRRSYLALIYGSPKQDRGQVSLRLGRSEADRKKMSTRARRGKEALTFWEAVERFGPSATLVRARLATGRTHQIRVHMASIGHPVLGDRTYGRKTTVEVRDPRTRGKRSVAFPRQMLHAEVLGFTHPVTGKYMEFRSPLPENMARALKELRGHE
jgi:23S rRNA pseudouridine1911/1915/1917 synthase